MSGRLRSSLKWSLIQNERDVSSGIQVPHAPPSEKREGEALGILSQVGSYSTRKLLPAGVAIFLELRNDLKKSKGAKDELEVHIHVAESVSFGALAPGPADWDPNPARVDVLRFWDGTVWIEDVHAAGSASASLT